MATAINESVNVLNAGAVAETDISKNDLDYLKAIQNHSMMGGAMVTMEEMMLMFTELAQGKFKQMQDKTSVGRDATDMANRVEGIIAKLASGKDVGELPPDVIEYMDKNNVQIGGVSIKEYLKANGHEPVMTPESEKIQQGIDYLNELLSGAKGGTVTVGHVTNVLNLLTNLEKAGILIDGKKSLDFFSSILVNNGIGKGYDISVANINKIKACVNDNFTPKLAFKEVKLDKFQLEEIKGALESTATRATDFVQSSQLKLQQLMQSFNTAVAMANAVQSMNGESTKSIAQSIR
ncbi:hypothetical protein [Rouxiella sp. S1S-2]|uniref:hypothetical protein n=1 Tax=Rouxiella sp. S1S-2 TaxID=2653856 RepID=UPI001D00221A|nr:hypothetical protein [Rouxiella sp. S1S-2]